jgi:hypothetical protein
VIELSRYVLEALRKDEEFILYRGRSQDDISRAAFACPDSSEMQTAEGGCDDLSDEALAKSEALAESGYGAPLVLSEANANAEGEPLGNVSPSRVLVLSPVAEHPSPESVKRLEHAYSFKEELDPAWAARPIDLARHRDRMVLVLEERSQPRRTQSLPGAYGLLDSRRAWVAPIASMQVRVKSARLLPQPIG